MAFAIGRISKQKGGSVGASSGHNNRQRETPNADPSKEKDNRVLIGDGRSVPERVKQVIAEHGGKPRSDSVEAVEALLTASPEWFLDDNEQIDQKKVDQFCEKAKKFLLNRKYCGICIGATLHMDEKTPHIHAHLVPIDPNGKLNCKHYFGSRQKLREWQNAFAKEMEPLGLERGVKDSRARHQDVKDFYKAITREHRIRVDPQKVPDPPRMFVTKDAAQKYKEEVIRAVVEQVKEPIRTQLDQAKLTREETAKRKEIEKRAERQIALVEKSALEAVRQLEQADQVNAALEQRNLGLQASNDALKKQLRAEMTRANEHAVIATQLSERTRDIPIVDVMDRLGYGREQVGSMHIYRDAQQQIAMLVADNQLRNTSHEMICRNSLSVVMHMRTSNEGQQNFTKGDAMNWLADNFGGDRAAGAFRVHQEHQLEDYFEDRQRRREMQERQQTQERPGQPREQWTSVREHTRLDRNGQERGGSDRGTPEHDIGFSR